MDWRKKLDSQKGAVLATEIKNNGFKVAKWTISAILAGSAFIKFGSVRIYLLILLYSKIMTFLHVLLTVYVDAKFTVILR